MLRTLSNNRTTAGRAVSGESLLVAAKQQMQNSRWKWIQCSELVTHELILSVRSNDDAMDCIVNYGKGPRMNRGGMGYILIPSIP